MRSTVHTTVRATPMQLAFGRDATLPCAMLRTGSVSTVENNPVK